MVTGVFRECEIEWKGEAYKFTPSMQVIRNIEMKGISIMSVIAAVGRGTPQASLMATVIGEVLRAAGAKATDDEIYLILNTDVSAALPIYFAVMEALSPSDPSAKKSSAAQE